MLLSVMLYGVAFLVTLVLFVKVLKTYFSYRFKVILSYVCLIGFMAIITLMMLLNLTYEFDVTIGPLKIELIDFILTSAIIAATLSWYFAIVLSHSSALPQRSYFIVFIAGMVFMGELLEKSTIFVINAFLETVGILFVVIETFNYLRDAYREIIDPFEKRYIKLYTLGFVVILSSGLMPVLGDIAVKYYNFPREVFEPGWSIIYSIGVLLIFYAVSKKPLVFIISKAYPIFLVLLNSNGTPCFTQKFQPMRSDGRSEFSEINVSEIFNSAKELIMSGKRTGSIDQGRRKILVGTYEGLTGMLVTNVETRYLREALQKATRLFWERYHDVLPTWTGETSQFTEFKNDVEHLFSLFTLFDEVEATIDLKAKEFDPLSKDSRILALLTDYTSNVGECPYYSENVPSKCLLDPTSRRPWDCEGKAFINGFVCQYILDYLEKKKVDQKDNFSK